MIPPLKLVAQATKGVPAVRFALGVAGVMAALSIGVTLFSSIPAAIIAAVSMLALMFLLFAFSLIATRADIYVQIPGLFLLYFVVLLTVCWCVLLTSCAFWEKPRPLPDLIGSLLGTRSGIVQGNVKQQPRLDWTTSKDRIAFDELPPSVRTRPDGSALNDDAREATRGTVSVTLSGTTLVLPDDGEARAIYASELTLRDGARIVTNGGRLRIFAATISSGGGAVISYEENALRRPPADPGVPGSTGGSGGEVLIDSSLRQGSTLSVRLPGQDGAQGGRGLDGGPGGAGRNGDNGADTLFGCAHGGGDGAPGAPGGKGGDGAAGGNGGDGGTLILQGPIASQGDRITFSAPGGAPGAGGPGGTGGPGGPGGSGGSGSTFCHGGRGGPTGSVGAPGATGHPGHGGSAGERRTIG